MRTYRVIVRGVFDGLTEPQRSDLRQRLADHDLFSTRFSEEGTTTYDGHLAAFSHRVLVRVDAGPDEEADAHTAGQLSALGWLEDNNGLGHRRLRSSATCTDDVRTRRR